MNQSPMTDISFGIKPDHSKKFADVRAKSFEGEKIRKSKRNKTYTAPKYAVGDVVVICTGYKTRDYCLVEIIDMVNFRGSSGVYTFYGVIQKTTVGNLLDRVGRMIHFEDSKWAWGWSVANVEDKGIRWLV